MFKNSLLYCTWSQGPIVSSTFLLWLPCCDWVVVVYSLCTHQKHEKWIPKKCFPKNRFKRWLNTYNAYYIPYYANQIVHFYTRCKTSHLLLFCKYCFDIYITWRTFLQLYFNILFCVYVFDLYVMTYYTYFPSSICLFSISVCQCSTISAFF